MRLLVRVGENCRVIMDRTMQNLSLPCVQVDELWTYVRCKQARLSFEDRFNKVGDQYCFVAIDAESKVIPHFDECASIVIASSVEELVVSRSN